MLEIRSAQGLQLPKLRSAAFLHAAQAQGQLVLLPGLQKGELRRPKRMVLHVFLHIV